jgi:hypothetical protein
MLVESLTSQHDAAFRGRCFPWYYKLRYVMACNSMLGYAMTYNKYPWDYPICVLRPEARRNVTQRNPDSHTYIWNLPG